MNTKRRAELQRKLTLNAVPRPPAGLAERIKADIPNYLEAETVPQRIGRSVTFHLRIAASVIVLMGAVIVAVTMTRTRPDKAASTAAVRPVIFAPSPRSMAAPAESTSTIAPVARTEEVQLEISQEEPIVQRQLAALRTMPPPAMVPPPSAASEESERDSAALDTESLSVPAQAAEVQPQRTAEYAPEVAAAMPEPAPVMGGAAAPAAPPAALTQADDAPASALRMERRQDRAKVLAEAKTEESVFGISVNPQVFNDIRATLASGRRPSASAVNTEAIVNYFAGAPTRAPRGVRLEVEASPAVIPAEGENAVLRFTVDTPAGSGIAANNARIEVVINDDVVAHVDRIGDTDPLARESALPAGTSVTGLYALKMKPGLRSSQVVATVRLTYTANGKSETVTKFIEGRDLAKSWQRASRRHRLASLGAVWAESLKGTPAGVDVAKRAQELATQDPDDVRAGELARAASASAAGGR